MRSSGATQSGGWRLHCVVRIGILVTWACAGATVASAAGESARELGTIKIKGLNEISGIAASRQNPYVYWLHNDGDQGKLFAVRATGKLAGVIDCPVAVEDVEDVAIGPGPIDGVDYLYLGDIGDNNSSRREIQVLRFVEPKLSGDGKIEVDHVARFRLVYPDTPHDAEALLVDPLTRDLYVITKEPGRARLYRAPASKLRDGAAITLELAGTPNVSKVSAGAISPDGRRIILRQDTTGWLWQRDAGESFSEVLAKQPTQIPVRGDKQGPNGEAVTFSPDGRRYCTISEGKRQAIYDFPVPLVSE
jgi:hypothetical protein